MGFEKSCTGIFGVIAVIVALRFGWVALKERKRYRQSENWVPITGLVTASNVNIESGDENTTYTPVITYTYQVMGQEYQGSQISFGSKGVSYSKQRKAEKIVARHPAGSQPTIHYNPADPSQAVLERQYNPSDVISGLGFGLVGLFLIYLGFLQ
jgi:hypothetical protein